MSLSSLQKCFNQSEAASAAHSHVASQVVVQLIVPTPACAAYGTSKCGASVMYR